MVVHYDKKAKSTKPDWFDLARYEGVHSLTYSDWLGLLEERSLLLFMRELETDEDKEPGFKYVLEDGSFFVNSHFYKVVSEPLIQHLKGKQECEKPLNELTLMDLRFLCGDVFEKYHLSNIFPDLECWLELEEDPKLFTDMGDEIVCDGGAFSTSTRALMIDVGADREILEKEFSKWLTMQKKQLEVNRMNPGREIANLINYKVLPYIDLYIWQKISGEKLTDAFIAKILFKDDYNKDVNTFRRQTKPLANEIVSRRTGYLDWLRHLVANDNN